MIRIPRLRIPALACVAGALVLGAGTHALAAGSIKAAYVEQVIPAKTWSGRVSFTSNPVAMGPGVGGSILGVTSITITNFDSAEQQVFIFAPLTTAGAGCASSGVVGAGNPMMRIYVQSHQTLHLTYPTPLVIGPDFLGGATCIGVQATTTLHGGTLEMDVNGVIN